jgi:hypothetical protein
MAIGVRRRATWLVPLALAGWLGGPLGCEPEPIDLVTPPTPGTGGTTPYDGGPDDAGADAGDDAAPPADAAPHPVLVGLDPNPRSPDGGPPGAADLLEAELTCRAVGVRAIVLLEPWNQLGDETIPALVARVASYRSKGLTVVLNVAVVDRKLDYRPVAVQSLAWDASGTTDALAATLDALVPALGPDLGALVLGRETDRYVLEHADEATGLTQFLALGVSHVGSMGASAPPVGVGLSFAGSDPPPSYQALLGLGALAVYTYFPGIGTPSVPTDTSVSHDLDAMITLGAERPLVLEAAGLTSAAALGSSPEQQRQFLDALFGALGARRAHFAVVNVHELHDRTASGCAAEAAAQGEPPDGSVAAYACETGLRAPDGGPKPAWQGFVQGAAAFASP